MKWWSVSNLPKCLTTLCIQQHFSYGGLVLSVDTSVSWNVLPPSLTKVKKKTLKRWTYAQKWWYSSSHSWRRHYTTLTGFLNRGMKLPLCRRYPKKEITFSQLWRATGYYQSLYLPTDAQERCFKRILKFTLKQLLHVSVQTPSSASVLFELVKVIIIKIIS